MGKKKIKENLGKKVKKIKGLGGGKGGKKDSKQKKMGNKREVSNSGG